jgi:hypothetical protein
VNRPYQKIRVNSCNSCLLFAGSLGRGNDFVEALVTAQIIPARVEAKITVCRHLPLREWWQLLDSSKNGADVARWQTQRTYRCSFSNFSELA